uniref:Uncharacterized protein n=1 Tax=Panagrolaimus sp. ES5 TaxID=591445 RepID=A0AC34FK85_9BILA
MTNVDLEMGIQNIHQILRRISQSRIIDGIEIGNIVMENVKEILNISKDLIMENEILLSENDNDVSDKKTLIEQDEMKKLNKFLLKIVSFNFS